MQVDGYKDLLLKQRDIMLALTKRLSDRDEQIMILQEELDAYDAAQRKLEDALDQRTAEVIAMRKAAIEEVWHGERTSVVHMLRVYMHRAPHLKARWPLAGDRPAPVQVAKSGGRTTHLQGALGAWGAGPPDVQERDRSCMSPRIGTLRSAGPGAIEACSSPGRSSTATESDTGACVLESGVLGVHGGAPHAHSAVQALQRAHLMLVAQIMCSVTLSGRTRILRKACNGSVC
jgi:hypothetical protein